MKSRFGFLIFDVFEDMDFSGPWEMIALWSQYYNGPQEFFTVSQGDGFVTSINNLVIQAHYRFEQCPKFDYLLVPGGQGTRVEVSNTILTNFIRSQAAHCQHVLSVCTGTFLLYAAGLLNGKKATTHWAMLDTLRSHAEVQVVEQRFVRDENIWTAAGISAGIDMALAFIAAISGNEIAGKVQLMAEYYPFNKIYTPGSDKLPSYVLAGSETLS